MTVPTTVPTNLRKPFTAHEFNIAGGGGLVPLDRNIALIGAMGSGTATALTPTEVFSESDAEAKFGIGSELTLMCRAAFAMAKLTGRQPHIFGVGLTDAGTKATYTLTVTGPATAAGDVELLIAGRTVRAPVASGDSAITVAASILAAVKAQYSDLPVSAAVGGSPNDHICTLTARNGGPNGNDIRAPTVVKQPAGIAVASAAGVSGATAYDLTTALDTLVNRIYNGVAVANHDSNTVTDLKTYAAARALPQQKAWSIWHMAETGSVATATGLASPANVMNGVIYSSEYGPNLTGEIAAGMACLVEGAEAKEQFDGHPTPFYPCPAAYNYTDAEIETLLAAGCTPLVMNAANDGLDVCRLVTTKTTENSVPFDRTADIHVPRSLYWLAWQVDARWRLAFQRAQKTERTREAVLSLTLDVLFDAEKAGYVQNVEAHKAELIVEADTVNLGRYNVAIPSTIIPALHQIVGVHSLILE